MISCAYMGIGLYKIYFIIKKTQYVCMNLNKLVLHSCAFVLFILGGLLADINYVLVAGGIVKNFSKKNEIKFWLTFS